MDFHKKRYYKVRQPSTAAATNMAPGGIFPASSIMHFCEEYMRGALNELLPPVKGSKIIGGGLSAAKYSLIPM